MPVLDEEIGSADTPDAIVERLDAAVDETSSMPIFSAGRRSFEPHEHRTVR